MPNEVNIYSPRYLAEVVRQAPPVHILAARKRTEVTERLLTCTTATSRWPEITR